MIGILKISSWIGLDVTASHYMGEIRYHRYSRLPSLKLERSIDQIWVDALKRDKDTFQTMIDLGIKETTDRFLSRDEVIEKAIGVFSERYPDGILLLEHKLGLTDKPIYVPDDTEDELEKWYQNLVALELANSDRSLDNQIELVKSKYRSILDQFVPEKE